MNIYRNKKTGVMLEIASEFGNNEVWEKVSPSPVADQVKAESDDDIKIAEAPKRKTTTRKAVKK